MDQKVGQEWLDHKERQQAEKEAERARRAEAIETSEKAAAAGKLATDLTDLIGFEKGEAFLSDIYDSRVSRPVAIGKLPNPDGSEDKFGFAKIAVLYGTERVEKTVTGRYFKKVEYEKVKTDRLEEVSVHFLAGNENATGLEYFASSRWCIAGDDNLESILAVERDLGMIAELVGYRPDADTEA